MLRCHACILLSLSSSAFILPLANVNALTCPNNAVPQFLPYTSRLIFCSAEEFSCSEGFDCLPSLEDASITFCCKSSFAYIRSYKYKITKKASTTPKPQQIPQCPDYRMPYFAYGSMLPMQCDMDNNGKISPAECPHTYQCMESTLSYISICCLKPVVTNSNSGLDGYSVVVQGIVNQNASPMAVEAKQCSCVTTPNEVRCDCDVLADKLANSLGKASASFGSNDAGSSDRSMLRKPSNRNVLPFGAALMTSPTNPSDVRATNGSARYPNQGPFHAVTASSSFTGLSDPSNTTHGINTTDNSGGTPANPTGLQNSTTAMPFAEIAKTTDDTTAEQAESLNSRQSNKELVDNAVSEKPTMQLFIQFCKELARAVETGKVAMSDDILNAMQDIYKLTFGLIRQQVHSFGGNHIESNPWQLAALGIPDIFDANKQKAIKAYYGGLLAPQQGKSPAPTPGESDPNTVSYSSKTFSYSGRQRVSSKSSQDVPIHTVAAKLPQHFAHVPEHLPAV